MFEVLECTQRVWKSLWARYTNYIFQTIYTTGRELTFLLQQSNPFVSKQLLLVRTIFNTFLEIHWDNYCEVRVDKSRLAPYAKK